jgi:hypothetical protein
MNGLNNLLYADSMNGARVAERRNVALEELGREARQAGIRPRKGQAQSLLVRLIPAAWTRSRRPTESA